VGRGGGALRAISTRHAAQHKFPVDSFGFIERNVTLRVYVVVFDCTQVRVSMASTLSFTRNVETHEIVSMPTWEAVMVC
jgi:hypothetical protein